MVRPRALTAPLDADDGDDGEDALDVPGSTRCVLVGPSTCGKTTMLLRMCARFARAHPRARVLYVAERGAMDRARIHASRAELSSDDARALERIGIKYARDDGDVRALACFRHAAPASEQPRLVVVDDLGSMIGRGGGDRVSREIAYARTLAALHESARDDETGESRAVVVSERTDGDTGAVPMQYVYSKWFGEVLQVHAVGEGTWDLVSAGDGETGGCSTRRAGDG